MSNNLNLTCTSWTCKTLKEGQRVSLRQEGLTGWDQKAYAKKSALVVGGGGVGGEVVLGLAKKGLGTIHVADPDTVQPTDLNRQAFTERDLYEPKASSLCKYVAQNAFLGSHLVAHDLVGQEVDLDVVRPDVFVVLVDLKVPGTRSDFCRIARERGLSLVVSAVNSDADMGYVFRQVPGGACWACALKPELSVSSVGLCPGVPASIDILKCIGGMCLYAVDTVLLARPVDWNLRVLSLSKGEYGSGRVVQTRSTCPVCGGRGA